MKKRIISVFLALALLCSGFCIGVSAANNLDKKIADIKLYVDKQVEVGKEFVLSVYIENITLSAGVVANDLPLYFDADKLSVLSVECVFPNEWAGYGDFFGVNPPVTEQPYYLRSLPDASDLMTNLAYRITESKAIGYKVKFSANKLGKAEISIVGDANSKNPIMLVSISGEDISNYGANGMTVSVEIVDEIREDVSSADVSDDVSSEDTTSDDTPSEDSDEPITGDPSDISEETSEGDESSQDVSADVDSSAEDSVASEDDVITPDSSDDSGDSDNTTLIIIVICAALLAIAAAVGVAVYVNKKKENK